MPRSGKRLHCKALKKKKALKKRGLSEREKRGLYKGWYLDKYTFNYLKSTCVFSLEKRREEDESGN